MKPGEHKTVQARILEYAEEIVWIFVPREEAGQRQDFHHDQGDGDAVQGTGLTAAFSTRK